MKKTASYEIHVTHYVDTFTPVCELLKVMIYAKIEEQKSLDFTL